MSPLPASWHAPLVRRRETYGDVLLERTEELVRLAHTRRPDPAAVQAAVDRCLALRQPAGEDPVVWLVLALAVQVDPQVPLQERLPWTRDGAA